MHVDKRTTRGQRHLAKAALNDPALTPPPITPHSEAEPGSFGAFMTDRHREHRQQKSAFYALDAA